MNRDQIIHKALRRFKKRGLVEELEELPESLPLVEEYCDTRLALDTFADMDVLFIQHHLGPYISRLHAMINHGMDATRCWFVDIPYSTNTDVQDKLIEMGFPGNQRAKPYNDPIAPYSRRQRERVAYVIKKLASQDSKRRLLVVDDGAYFMRTLKYLLWRDEELVASFRERGTYVVEQTTRGHRYFETEEVSDMLKSLNIPAVSIARCCTKSNLESPFIGAAVSRAMLRNLKGINRLANGLGRVLVIGFGAVGKATVQALSDPSIELKPDEIDVYDKNWRGLQTEINEMGANALRTLPNEGQYNCVFGCTGYASFPIEKIAILANDSLLASGSSAAIEFNREKFIDRAYEDDKDDFFVIEPEKTRVNGIHATIEMQKGNKRFSFLKAGFPINFDGRKECLPALIIQITHSLLLAASREVLCQEPGFHKLNQKDDDCLNERGLYWIKRYSNQDL